MTAKTDIRTGDTTVPLYQAGESEIPGRKGALKLSSNENTYGPSPKAVVAARDALRSLSRYPSSDHRDLKAAISDVHGLPGEMLVCGAGSDEVLAFLCQAYAGPGDEVIYTRHGFLMYPILARAVGATPVEVEENGRRVDVDKILANCNDRTRVVMFSNPSNPTGTMMGADELERLADSLPPHIMLALDGAYFEYADQDDGGIELARKRENVVATRTFSKIYGLASLRVGYAFGSAAVIDRMNRLRGPFNLTGPSLAAAEAAVRDTEHVRKCCEENARLRCWMAARLAAVGVDSDRSYANFILARFAEREEALACDAHLRDSGIIVRRMDQYKLPNCLRITIGDESACTRVCDVVARFKGRAP